MLTVVQYLIEKHKFKYIFFGVTFNLLCNRTWHGFERH